MDVSKLMNRQFANQNELVQALQELYLEDKAEYTRQRGTSPQFPIVDEDQWVCLNDCIQEAGSVGGYFFQDMWAAREIYRSNVKHVFDIGSRMDGYIAHLLSMEVHVTLLDIRPFPHKVEGIDFIQTNATDLSNIPDESIETLSSLCALEHFGLGRYGDPIDYNGWKKSLHAIKRKIKVGGTFYLSVPVGNVERVQFNAHRIFKPMTIINELTPELELYEFSYIDVPNTRIVTCLKGGGDLSAVKYATENLIGKYVFGLFTFKKRILTPPRYVTIILLLLTIQSEVIRWLKFRSANSVKMLENDFGQATWRRLSR